MCTSPSPLSSPSYKKHQPVCQHYFTGRAVVYAVGIDEVAAENTFEMIGVLQKFFKAFESIAEHQ